MNSLSDPNLIRILESLIRKIVKQELTTASFNKMIPATVVNLTGDLLNVKLNGEDTVLSE
jgi:hypothetical protein